MTYKAPVNEIRFALMQEAGFQRLIDNGAYQDLSDDLLDAILEEAAKLADNVIAPISWDGDQTGASLGPDGVSVPESFKQAYQKYVEGGWPTLAAPQAYGGQGLPLALANAVTEMMNSNIGFQLCPMLSNGGMEALAAHASDDQKESSRADGCDLEQFLIGLAVKEITFLKESSFGVEFQCLLKIDVERNASGDRIQGASKN